MHLSLIHNVPPSVPDKCVNCEADVPEGAKCDDPCLECGAPYSGRSQCHECSEWKNDPDDFYDGLRCIMCCEEDEEEDD